MGVLLLTGPPGAGKNTVAALLAPRLHRCAVIDVDLVRWMVLRPHRAPWDGEEGAAQGRLGVRNACLLARSFVGAGFAAVIHDVISDETARLYRAELAGLEPRIVLLLPALEEIRRRNRLRGPRLTDDEIAMLYERQARLTRYDWRIDNTALPPEALAGQLASFI